MSSSSSSRPPVAKRVLGMRVDATSYEQVTGLVLAWARERASRYVCAANAHMVMEGYDCAAFQRVVNNADVVVPDGMPLVWALRWLGVPGQRRVYGPTLMLHVCEAAARAGVPVGFYGGHRDALMRMVARLRQQFPCLEVAYAVAPPFGDLAAADESQVEWEIEQSGARVLFVGLGCPKQERWMAARGGRVPAVMVGVGAAFDFHSGRVRQAPAWVQAAGLEWLFRLGSDPRRLSGRYLKHNPRFAFLLARQLVRAARR